MKFIKLLLNLACTALALQMPCVFAQTSATDNPFVGGYRRGSVDTMTELFILEDKTFCFAFTGGSADLAYAGRWKMQGDSIVLEEIKRDVPMFPIAASKNVELTQGRRVRFTGRGLSGDSTIIFGTSTNGELPADMKPVLSPDHNGYASRYTVPISTDPKTSIFVGFAVQEPSGETQKPPVYKITQYKLDDSNFNTYTVNFNRDGAKPALRFEGILKDGKLYIRGSDTGSYGEKRPISDKLLPMVKERCINPVLEQKPLEPLRTSTWLKPARELEATLNMQDKAPMFSVDHKED